MKCRVMRIICNTYEVIAIIPQSEAHNLNLPCNLSNFSKVNPEATRVSR